MTTMANQRTYPQYDLTFQIVDQAGNTLASVPGIDGTHRFAITAANTNLQVEVTHHSNSDPFPMVTISFKDVP
jgi:hypothetical protein